MPHKELGDPGLEIRLLGPVEVWLGDRRFDVRRQQQRAVLAILALKANRVVSSDELIDALWGERPPPTAPVALYGLVSGLRKLLGAEGTEAIVTTPPGYLLQLAPERIDLGRFEQLVAQGRRALDDHDPGGAAERLREALSLWHGPPMQDLAFLPFAQTESARLDELRLAATEDRIEADLARGRDGELVPELEGLVAEHPLRERPRGQLMRALYAADRQADALAAYRDARDVLVGELGLEPSEDLQELERAILRHDPALAAGVGPINAAGTGRARIDRSRWKWIATAGITATTVLVLAVLVATRAIRDSSVGVAADGIAVLDKGKLVAEGRAGASPSEVASGGGSVWITSSDDHTVARINPGTGDVQDTIPVGSGAGGVAADESGVWVTNSLEGSASRIDPRANKVVDTVSVGTAPVAVAIGHGSVWVVSRDDQTLWGIDARTGAKSARIPIPEGAAPRGVAVTSRAVWVADEARGAVFRVDPDRETVVDRINVGNGPSSIVSGHGFVWVANSLDGTVSRIDPRRDTVTAVISVGDGPSGLAVGPEGVWVSNEFGGTVVLINPRTGRIQRTVHIGERPEGLAAVGTKVVVAFRSDNSSHRGGTLRVATAGRPPGPPMDTLTQVPSTTLTNDGLVAFRRVGGADSTQLVPDLAVTIPTPTDQGRTYTFRVREGIRYSIGQLLRPADFRRALERAFILRRDLDYYGGIVGAAACIAKPARCDLSRGIVANAAARTVTFHLRAPDPDFLYKLALPPAFALPPGTPNRLARTRPLPATGPYMPERTKRANEVLVFVRNPRFKEWSKAAQPDGYPDRIEFRARPSSRAAVRATERGTADVAWVRIPPDLDHEIRTQYASQVHENPVPGVTYLFLNTRVPPFNDVRARRAINFAADRASGARVSGRGVGGDPSCQILPPDFTGFQRYCPYTARPISRGFWRAPDLRRARRLVGASGTKGAVVTVWVPDNHRGEGPFAASLFHSLGYRVRLKRVGTSFYPDLASGRVHPDPAEAGLFTWFADYPAASNYIAKLFSCGFNLSNFCDRAVDMQIRHALELQMTDPYLANQLWAKLDRALVDKAPVVPLFTLKTVDLVSRRVGNYQYSMQWGTLLAQLWVR
jgi:YVTN family beta-propeller protein